MFPPNHPSSRLNCSSHCLLTESTEWYGQAVKLPLHVTTLLHPHLTQTPLVEGYVKEAKMCYVCLCCVCLMM